jgi:hypothetical protein
MWLSPTGNPVILRVCLRPADGGQPGRFARRGGRPLAFVRACPVAGRAPLKGLVDSDRFTARNDLAGLVAVPLDTPVDVTDARNGQFPQRSRSASAATPRRAATNSEG